jgi:ABC-type glycerol-3-phosphate transport system substrate-binding protein
MRRVKIMKRLLPVVLVFALLSIVVFVQAVTAKTIEMELMVNSWAPSVIQAMQDGLKRFEEQNPGVKVTITTNTSQNPFLVRYAGGTAPDVIALGMAIGGYGEQGILMPLDDMVKKSGLREQIIEDTWPTGSWGGTIYGVPAIDNGPRIGMVWNTDMLNEAGLSINGNEVMIPLQKAPFECPYCRSTSGHGGENQSKIESEQGLKPTYWVHQ